ncbi:uncharacterized protein LOC128922083 [Zeugodacus cucurbitae]|uniref:uncharacterized protein LOC128922082 n=1 Tax=Zeugodacus cucurbitae TaxID=28588 RepID=UPI0023D963C7|nr:uncharacterized protein LOC128922082 [Zeugodacus cucurbitae]XP_054087518.1 uncharacterized protein LOC128922083 [Zeugodacus cucurbitae]
MAVELQQQGVLFTAAENKTKMHNLTQRFRKEKTAVGSTGGSSSKWHLYQKMSAILSPYFSYNTESLVEESFYSSVDQLLLFLLVFVFSHLQLSVRFFTPTCPKLRSRTSENKSVAV